MEEFEDKEIRELNGPLDPGNYMHCLFQNCVFEEKAFSGSSFQDCRFQDCLFNQVDLKGVRLKGVEFADSKLMGLDFRHCDRFLFSPDFTNSKLFRCSFSEMKSKTGFKFLECIVEECDFYGAKIPKTSFFRSSLRGSNFQNADLTECNFEEAIDLNIDVTQTRISKCKFSSTEVLSLLNVFDLEIV